MLLLTLEPLLLVKLTLPLFSNAAVFDEFEFALLLHLLVPNNNLLDLFFLFLLLA